MKIRIKTNLGSADFPDQPWKAGEERDVSDELGSALVARGVAVDLAAKPPAPKPQPKQPQHLRGVQGKPSISETKPPAVSGDQSKAEK